VGKTIINFFQKPPQSESSAEIDPYSQFDDEPTIKSPKKEKAVEIFQEISNESPKKENEQATNTISNDNSDKSENSEMSESTDEASSNTQDRTKKPKKKR
jgi:hypothetical protein